MAIYRVFSDADGQSHIEDLKLEEHPELGAMINVSEVRVQEFDGSRNMDFHPLPERRLVIHLSGEVEIGASDGAKRVLRAGDIRLMDDVTGRGPYARRPFSVGRGLRPAERLTFKLSGVFRVDWEVCSAFHQVPYPSGGWSGWRRPPGDGRLNRGRMHLRPKTPSLWWGDLNDLGEVCRAPARGESRTGHSLYRHPLAQALGRGFRPSH